MTDESVTVTFEVPDDPTQFVICRAGQRAVWIDQFAKPGGDGSRERPFRNLDEAFSSPDQPESKP